MKIKSIKKNIIYILFLIIIIPSTIFLAFLNSSCNNSNIIPYDKLKYKLSVDPTNPGMEITDLADNYVPPKNAILKLPKCAPNGGVIKSVGFPWIFDHLDTNARYLNITKLDLSECEANAILGHCFDSWNLHGDIILPKTIISLGMCSFANCSHIASVKFNDGLQTIFSQCFQDCTSLKQKLYLPDSIQKVYADSFNGTQVEYDNIDSDTAGTCCFSYVDESYHHRWFFKLGDNNTRDYVSWGYTLDIYGFSDSCLSGNNLKNVKDFEIPVSTYILGDGMFFRSQSESLPCLEKIVFPDSFESHITNIPNYFMYNDPLTTTQGLVTNVGLPTTITSIGDYAFTYNDLQTINIPNNVGYIGSYAFQGNDDLLFAQLSNNTTYIGAYAFADSAIETIKIPASIRGIGDDAFNSCPNLKNIYFFGLVPYFDLLLGIGIIRSYNQPHNYTPVEHIYIPANADEDNYINAFEYDPNNPSDEGNCLFEDLSEIGGRTGYENLWTKGDYIG